LADPEPIFLRHTLIAHPEFSVVQVDIFPHPKYDLSPCPWHLYLNNRLVSPLLSFARTKSTSGK
jgi:hypothetical protein